MNLNIIWIICLIIAILTIIILFILKTTNVLEFFYVETTTTIPPTTTTTVPATTQTCPPCILPPVTALPKSIINVNSGYIIDIINVDTNQYQLIHHYIQTCNTADCNNIPDGVYAVDNDNNLIITMKNKTQTNQIWNAIQLTDSSNSSFVILTTENKTCNDITTCAYNALNVLTFENTMSGYVLTNVPFDNKERQRWRFSTTENSPYGKLGSIYVGADKLVSLTNNPLIMNGNTNNNMNTDTNYLHLNSENDDKLKSVLDLISNNLQSFQQNVNHSNSAASLGITQSPIKINLTLTGNTGNSGNLTKESFGGIGSESYDILDRLNQFEKNPHATVPNNSINSSQMTQLEKSIIGCPPIDNKEYALNRVGQCNCNLSDIKNL